MTASQLSCVKCVMMKSFLALLVAVCLAASVHGQDAAAPSSSVSTPTLYQRPNNSDCVTTASSSTNYFPLQFQIAGTSPSQGDRVNVRLQLWPIPVSRLRQDSQAFPHSRCDAHRSPWRKTSQCSTWTRTRYRDGAQHFEVLPTAALPAVGPVKSVGPKARYGCTSMGCVYADCYKPFCE